MVKWIAAIELAIISDCSPLALLIWARVWALPWCFSIIGVTLLFVSGWLGGQMVHVYAVGGEGRE